jgi:hypothetical protein
MGAVDLGILSVMHVEESAPPIPVRKKKASAA